MKLGRKESDCLYGSVRGAPDFICPLIMNFVYTLFFKKVHMCTKQPKQNKTKIVTGVDVSVYDVSE